MSEMEEKLGSILGNPQLMQQIMTMAQSLGAPSGEESAPPPAPVSSPAAPVPGMDPAMLGALSSLAAQTGMDANQQNLLKALSPYISPQRSHKLEKAMRAAKLAQAASGFLGAGGLSLLTGR